MSLELRLEGVYTPNREYIAGMIKHGYSICRKLGVDVRLTLFRSGVASGSTHRVTNAHSVVLTTDIAESELTELSSAIEKHCSAFIDALK